MALFSLIAVLLIEQIKPLPYRVVVQAPLARFAQLLEERFNAGESRHGMAAWLLGVGFLVLLAGGGYWAMRAVNPLLAWAWNVVILYLTMGFRQFSHYYTDIQLALRMDDLPHARALLAEWRGEPGDELPPADIARLSIQQALVAAHMHVFAVLLCFVLLPGPCGAVLYRVAAFFAQAWGRRATADADDFGGFARRAFSFIDWLPARMTAAGFAVVGNFEDAVYCWKTHAGNWADAVLGRGKGIVLASGAGALGLRLGALTENAEEASGDEADMALMQSAVGLVWRALLLWLLILLLLGLAGLMAS